MKLWLFTNTKIIMHIKNPNKTSLPQTKTINNTNFFPSSYPRFISKTPSPLFHQIHHSNPYNYKKKSSHTMKNSFLKWIFLLISILFLGYSITFENKHCSKEDFVCRMAGHIGTPPSLSKS
jgi:hypothetical protein